MSDDIGDRKIIFKNIVVQCGLDDTDHPPPDDPVLTLHFVDIHSQLEMKKVAEGRWMHEGEEESSFLVDHISILLLSENGQFLGSTVLSKSDWTGGNDDGVVGTYLERKFQVDSGSPNFTLSLDIQTQCINFSDEDNSMEIVIENMVVECQLADVDNPALSGLRLTILETDSKFNLKRISETQWEYGSEIVCSSEDNLSIKAGSEIDEDLGLVFLAQQELVQDQSTNNTQYIRKDFEQGNKKLKLSLLMKISYVYVMPDESDAFSIHFDEEDLDIATALNQLGTQYLDTFSKKLDKHNLYKAIEAYEQANFHLSAEDTRIIPYLEDTAAAYLQKYNFEGELEDLDKAIGKWQSAIPNATTKELSRLVNNLGVSYQTHFEHTGDLTDLSEAIQNLQKAVQLTSEDYDELPGSLNNLGISYKHRFEVTKDMADLAEALQNYQQAIKLTSDNDINLPGRLNNLGTLYQCAFEINGELADLAKAIENLEKAVQIASKDYANISALLSNLGVSYQSHFERTGDIADLYKAIQNKQQAIDYGSKDHAVLPQLLSNLGISYQSLYKRTGDIKDLSVAIQNFQQAIDLTPKDHIDLSSRYSHLGTSYEIWFEKTGDIADLHKAIENHQQALKFGSQDHTDQSIWLTGLGTSYQTYFEYTGDIEDLSKAIQNLQQAVKSTPEGHPDLPASLNNLGISYQSRFERTGNIVDLVEAIQIVQQAVKLTPQNHIDLPSRLNNLGIFHGNYFEKTKDLTYLTKAIQYQNQAIELTPKGHIDLPARLNSLGISYENHFETTKDIADLSMAISNKQHAINLSSENHADLAGWFNSLGNSYQSCFETTGDINDLSKAISSYQKGIKLTPDNHVVLPRRHSNLGNSYLHYYQFNGDQDSLEKAAFYFHLATMSSIGLSAIQFNAAMSWIKLSKLVSYSEVELLNTYEHIVTLLTHSVGLDTTLHQRYNALVDVSQLVLAAAAAAISFRKYSKAVEWLEQGRCIIWSQFNQFYTPIGVLLSQYPDLAQRLSFLSNALQSAGFHKSYDNKYSLHEKISWEKNAYDFLKFARERDSLLATIQSKSGFQEFLQPKKFSTLKTFLPLDGLAVIINVQEEGCDALAILSNLEEPIHIPLPRFSYTDITRNAEHLQNYLAEENLLSRGSSFELRGIRFNNSVSKLSTILKTLWEKLVKPILDKLSLSSPESNQAKQHIWWCPTGPLVFLPIHAAGIYADGKGSSGQCLSDFAISSYIPNLTALIEKSAITSKKSTGKDGILLVSQPNTPGLKSIPKTSVEVQIVRDQLSAHGIPTLMLDDKNGTVNQVLTSLESFSCVHLACHGSQNTEDPLKSAFHLYNGPLELSTIIGKNLPQADFAFLSACETSTGHKDLSEEAVHLAAGMLVAGYRSVVATMWSIPDKIGPIVAESFYQNLLKKESGQLDSAGAAQALDAAMESLKKSNLSTFDPLLVWVPYIHVGI